MKTKLCLIASLVALASQRCAARLNETLDQCIARYGEPLKPQFSKTLIRFKKSGFLISAFFHDGKCESLHISKDDEFNVSETLSEVEITALLEANSGGAKWIRNGNSWATADGVRVAESSPMSLMITTADGQKRQKAAGAATEKEKLKGF